MNKKIWKMIGKCNKRVKIQYEQDDVRSEKSVCVYEIEAWSSYIAIYRCYTHHEFRFIFVSLNIVKMWIHANTLQYYAHDILPRRFEGYQSNKTSIKKNWNTSPYHTHEQQSKKRSAIWSPCLKNRDFVQWSSSNNNNDNIHNKRGEFINKNITWHRWISIHLCSVFFCFICFLIWLCFIK